MYQQEKYIKRDKNHIFEFLQNHPFAVFVMEGERLLATHIPILSEGDAENFRLFGHIAHNNEQFSHLKTDATALLIFQGPHAYVSSSWYKDKDISTWDYSAVHINGKIIVQTEKELENSLKKLVAHFEKKQKKPLWYDDIPKEILESHLPLIKGFWIEPTSVQAISKFHQGFEKEDIETVIEQLNKQENRLAQEVGKNIKTENNGNH